MNTPLEQLDPQIIHMAAALAHGRLDLADDLAQEGRIGAWRAIERYEADSPVPADRFAMVAARFAMVDELRREGRRPPADELPDLVGSGATVEDLVGGVQEWTRLLALLPERSAIVLRASRLGYSAEDLALLLDLSADRTRQLRLDAVRELVNVRGPQPAPRPRQATGTRRRARQASRTRRA